MKIKIALYALALMLGVSSCSEKEISVPAGSIGTVVPIPGNGQIKLQWEKPTDGTVLYVRVNYHDPLIDKDLSVLSSTDTILIRNTRAKFGTYHFTLQPFSSTGEGGALQEIDTQSLPAPATREKHLIELNAKDLSTNAQEKSEGPISNLLDGNTGTYFHTSWSQSIPGPHWLAIGLPRTIKAEEVFQFTYSPRTQNGNNKPTDFDLMGSENGTDWFLIKNFTQDADNLPTDNHTSYTSPEMKSPKPFSHIKIVVKKTNNGTTFFTMSEFRIWTWAIFDPEA